MTQPSAFTPSSRAQQPKVRRGKLRQILARVTCLSSHRPSIRVDIQSPARLKLFVHCMGLGTSRVSRQQQTLITADVGPRTIRLCDSRARYLVPNKSWAVQLDLATGPDSLPQ